MFPGIADRMGKEITALAPSSMKIKGALWIFLLLITHTFCVPAQEQVAVSALGCKVVPAAAAAASPMRLSPVPQCQWMYLCPPLLMPSPLSSHVLVCSGDSGVGCNVHPVGAAATAAPNPSLPSPLSFCSGGSPREEIQRVDRRIYSLLPLHLPAGALEVEGWGWGVLVIDCR